MALIDTHCHLTFEPMASDRQGVLARARAAGVTRVVVPAYDRASWDQVAQVADGVRTFAALGLHPWVADEPLDPDALADALTRSRAVAVGEIGLDTAIEGADLERQREVLALQLEVAARLELPVILHCRGAFEELIALLEGQKHWPRGVMHAFSKSPELARRLVNLGLHIAFGGAVTRPRATRAKKSAAAVPADRLLLETDAPSIGLDGVDPPDVEPRHVADIAAAAAELRGVSLEELARTTTENACRLFHLP